MGNTGDGSPNCLWLIIPLYPIVFLYLSNLLVTFSCAITFVVPSNASEIFGKKDVDGGLIGGASLKAEDFIGIITAFN